MRIIFNYVLPKMTNSVSSIQTNILFEQSCEISKFTRIIYRVAVQL